ncbi:MAG: twin-arginine translocase subunit TatC [Conexivisphaerales archaeon]
MSGRSDRSMPIWDHISELIKRMKIVVITFIVSTLVALAMPVDLSFLKNSAFYRTPAILLLDLINQTERPKSLILIAGSITAPLELWVIAAALMGGIVTAPVFAYQLYRFVDPALYPSERKAVYPVVFSFTTLFLIGFLFGWFVLIPFMFWGLLPFFGFVNAQPVIFVMDFYTLVLLFLAITGLAFTLPVFFVLLVRFHILHTSIITKNRRYYYAALYIVAALITPDGGIWADLALFLPLAALTEIAILVSRRYEKPEKKETAEAAAPTPALVLPARCKFCGDVLTKGNPFCPNCKRSQI